MAIHLRAEQTCWHLYTAFGDVRERSTGNAPNPFQDRRISPFVLSWRHPHLSARYAVSVGTEDR